MRSTTGRPLPIVAVAIMVAVCGVLVTFVASRVYPMTFGQALFDLVSGFVLAMAIILTAWYYKRRRMV